jgi:hypothetical protein
MYNLFLSWLFNSDSIKDKMTEEYGAVSGNKIGRNNHKKYPSATSSTNPT